jgi:signal recognition particle GTPase
MTTDWLATLHDQAEIGKQMAEEVPRTLANADVSVEQVRRLFQALDHQAHFVEKLTSVLEEGGHDLDIVDAARKLEELFAELAAAAAEKMVQMR